MATAYGNGDDILLYERVFAQVLGVDESEEFATELTYYASELLQILPPGWEFVVGENELAGIPMFVYTETHETEWNHPYESEYRRKIQAKREELYKKYDANNNNFDNLANEGSFIMSNFNASSIESNGSINGLDAEVVSEIGFEDVNNADSDKGDADPEATLEDHEVVFAQLLGVDLDEKYFLVLAFLAKELMRILPEGWELLTSVSSVGTKVPYYFENATGTSHWTHPYESQYKDVITSKRVSLLAASTPSPLGTARSGYSEESFNSTDRLALVEAMFAGALGVNPMEEYAQELNDYARELLHTLPAGWEVVVADTGKSIDAFPLFVRSVDRSNQLDHPLLAEHTRSIEEMRNALQFGVLPGQVSVNRTPPKGASAASAAAGGDEGAAGAFAEPSVQYLAEQAREQADQRTAEEEVSAVVARAAVAAASELQARIAEAEKVAAEHAATKLAVEEKEKEAAEREKAAAEIAAAQVAAEEAASLLAAEQARQAAEADEAKVAAEEAARLAAAAAKAEAEAAAAAALIKEEEQKREQARLEEEQEEERQAQLRAQQEQREEEERQRVLEEQRLQEELAAKKAAEQEAAEREAAERIEREESERRRLEEEEKALAAAKQKEVEEAEWLKQEQLAAKFLEEQRAAQELVEAARRGEGISEGVKQKHQPEVHVESAAGADEEATDLKAPAAVLLIEEPAAEDVPEVPSKFPKAVSSEVAESQPAGNVQDQSSTPFAEAVSDVLEVPAEPSVPLHDDQQGPAVGNADDKAVGQESPVPVVDSPPTTTAAEGEGEGSPEATAEDSLKPEPFTTIATVTGAAAAESEEETGGGVAQMVYEDTTAQLASEIAADTLQERQRAMEAEAAIVCNALAVETVRLLASAAAEGAIAQATAEVKAVAERVAAEKDNAERKAAAAIRAAEKIAAQEEAARAQRAKEIADQAALEMAASSLFQQELELARQASTEKLLQVAGGEGAAELDCEPDALSQTVPADGLVGPESPDSGRLSVPEVDAIVSFSAPAPASVTNITAATALLADTFDLQAIQSNAVKLQTQYLDSTILSTGTSKDPSKRRTSKRVATPEGQRVLMPRDPTLGSNQPQDESPTNRAEEGQAGSEAEDLLLHGFGKATAGKVGRKSSSAAALLNPLSKVSPKKEAARRRRAASSLVRSPTPGSKSPTKRRAHNPHHQERLWEVKMEPDVAEKTVAGIHWCTLGCYGSYDEALLARKIIQKFVTADSQGTILFDPRVDISDYDLTAELQATLNPQTVPPTTTIIAGYVSVTPSRAATASVTQGTPGAGTSGILGTMSPPRPSTTSVASTTATAAGGSVFSPRAMSSSGVMRMRATLASPAAGGGGGGVGSSTSRPGTGTISGLTTAAPSHPLPAANDTREMIIGRVKRLTEKLSKLRVRKDLGRMQWLLETDDAEVAKITTRHRKKKGVDIEGQSEDAVKVKAKNALKAQRKAMETEETPAMRTLKRLPAMETLVEADLMQVLATSKSFGDFSLTSKLVAEERRLKEELTARLAKLGKRPDGSSKGTAAAGSSMVDSRASIRMAPQAATAGGNRRSSHSSAKVTLPDINNRR